MDTIDTSSARPGAKMSTISKGESPSLEVGAGGKLLAGGGDLVPWFGVLLGSKTWLPNEVTFSVAMKTTERFGTHKSNNTTRKER